MSGISGEHGTNYWPGYVDALVNVVLNLMFLTAILAVGSFTQGLDSASRHQAGKSVATTAEPARAAPEPARPAVSKPRRRVRAAGGATRELRLRFADGTVRIDDGARERLKRELLRHLAQGMQTWQVSVDTDVDDKFLRRTAYLRMMAVRNVFLEVGIEPERFDLRMRSGAPGQQVVSIVPSKQPPTRKAPATRTDAGSTGPAPAPQPETPGRRG